jgi:hypothetical protein
MRSSARSPLVDTQACQVTESPVKGNQAVLSILMPVKP